MRARRSLQAGALVREIADGRVSRTATSATALGRGHALIINDLRARNASCSTALNVAGANTLGNELPRGWRCRSVTPTNARTVCTRGSARLSYIFAGGE